MKARITLELDLELERIPDGSDLQTKLRRNAERMFEASDRNGNVFVQPILKRIRWERNETGD